MKAVLHKIASLFMAFVVLFSTMSFTIDMHYCGDTLMDTAIFHKADTCGMEMENTSAKDCSLTKKKCCSDEQLVVNGQDELQLSVYKISFEQQVFVASLVYAYIHLFESVDKHVSSYEDYRPPLVVRQLYKLDETYLI